MLNDCFRKSQSKHVSFDGSINLNNNNSSTYQHYIHDTNQNSRQKKYRRTETIQTTSDDIDRKLNKKSKHSFLIASKSSIGAKGRVWIFLITKKGYI
jgi:hypothetical protein